MPAFTSADPAAYVGLAIQSAQGTPNSTQAKFRFAKYDAGMDAQPDIAVVDMREGGDGLDWGFTYKQRHVVRGTLVLNARSEFTGQVLAMALGGATWDGGSAPALHRYHSRHASFPFGTIHYAFPGTDMMQLFTDARMTGLTIEGGPGGVPIKITAPFVAPISGGSAAPIVPSYAGEEPWLYHVGPSYLLDGSADSAIESWRIDVAYGLDELQAQSVQLDDIIHLNRDINFTLTRRYQNSTLWKKIAYMGGQAPSSGVATGAFQGINQVPGAAGAAIRYLELNLPLLSYRTNALPALDPNGVTVRETVTAKALNHASGALHIAMRNAHASAYGP